MNWWRNIINTKINWHFSILLVLGTIIVIHFTGEFYNYNEKWNKIQRQGLKPTLVSGDGITNQISGNYYNLEFYRKYGIKNSYWNPFIFGGMSSVFSGVQHFLVGFVFAVSGTALSFIWGWMYILDLIPVVFVLWLMIQKPVTPEQIAIAREDQKICKSLFLLIAGWLVFYWFYAEVR